MDIILYKLETADTRHGPIILLKIDISDGFYRIPLQLDSIAQLGALLPKERGEEQLIAFPTVLPMGWKNSPPIFCAATETITDLANEQTHAKLPAALEPLRLEEFADSKPPRIKRSSVGQTKSDLSAMAPVVATGEFNVSAEQTGGPAARTHADVAVLRAATHSDQTALAE